MPNGGLTSAYKRYSSSSWHAQVTRFDERGRMRWVRRLGNYSYAYQLMVLPDGAYVVASTDPGRVPAPTYRYTDFGIKLYKLSPAGDSITSVWVPASGYHDKARGLVPTRDGGLLVIGYNEPSYNSVQTQALCIKLDSVWQEQWRYSIPGYFWQAQELANGHFVIAGATLPPYYLAELVPPSHQTAADTLPTIAWQLGNLPVDGRTMFCEPNGSIRLFGDNDGLGVRDADLGIQYLTGLASPPVSVDLCARPPVLGSAPTVGLLVGNTLAFTLDSTTTQAGPRYGEVSLVTWDFGDGTPADTGWVVSHAFASPQPVRVQVCAVNNLWCRTCADLYPFGPLGVGQELAAVVSIYPNPSASGVFGVRLGAGVPPGGTYVVLDGLGRLVTTGALGGAETALDLRAQAAGVYALRLTWVDGRSVTRLLVRW